MNTIHKTHIGILILFVVVGFQNVIAQNNFKLPAHESFTLENGLKVYMMVQEEVPLIHFRAVLPAGVRYDTAAHAGLAGITADALSTGTRSYNKATIEETLDFLGASVYNGAGTEAAVVTANYVNKDQNQVLPIIAEMITAPVFPKDEFSKLAQRAVAAIDQKRESPRRVIRDYFNALVYDTHPYANSASGTKKSLEALEVSDLENFYNTHYTPRGTAIAVVGDFNPNTMKELLTNLFKNWNNPVPPPAPAAPIQWPKQPKVVIVNKEDARETTMLVGGVGVARNTKDYIGIQVINTILGGRFTSWLNDELRVNSGLTYGARSSFNALKEGGTFSMSTFTANQTTAETVALLLKTYQKIFEQGIDQSTLSSAKNYVKGQFPPNYETNAALARFLTDTYVYGVPKNYIDLFSNTVDSLTVKDAKRIITTYFPKENLQMVFIGKASIIRPIVSQYGMVKVLEISEDMYY